MKNLKTLGPTNQKSVYNSYSDLYGKLMNDEIVVEKAEAAVKILSGMNRTFALEIKYSELQGKTEIRRIEPINFEEDKK